MINTKKITLALLSLCTAFFASAAHAEFEEGKNSMLFAFGFTEGGLGLGFDFEHGYHRTFGIGGYFRMYPDSNSNPTADGITTVGAFIRPHFSRQAWDFYLSPGFGMISIDPASANRDDETLLGPSFAIGLLYEFTPQVSFGVEQMSLYSWFGEENYRGSVTVDDFMAKFRFIF